MKTERPHAVVTLSGGADSTVALAWAIAQGYQAHVIFFDWGQKTVEKERQCVSALAEHYGIADVREIALPWIRHLGATLTDKNSRVTAQNEYVPFRNSIFFSAATAFAEMIRAEAVVVGSAGGDHNCPDNRPVFLDAFQQVMATGTQLRTDIRLIAPLRDIPDKKGAIELGMRLGVPFELTWSCHNSTDQACGYCSNCESRLEAFKLLGEEDPIDYAKKEKK